MDVPAVAPHQIVDPTGVGDAYRGGLLKGLAAGADLPTCAKVGTVAATYALEHLGGLSHAYTLAEFAARYEEHFGAPADRGVARGADHHRHAGLLPRGMDGHRRARWSCPSSMPRSRGG